MVRLGHPCSQSPFTPSQSFYFGAVTGRPVESVLVEGQPLDRVSGVVSIGPQPKPVKTDHRSFGPCYGNRQTRPKCAAPWRLSPTSMIGTNGLKSAWHFTLNLRAAMKALTSGRIGRASPLKFDERDQSQKMEILPAQRRSASGRCLKSPKPMAGKGNRLDFAKATLTICLQLPEPEKQKPSTLTFLTPDDCESAPSRGYLIKGLFAPGDVACIFGAPGAGKSLIAHVPWLYGGAGQEASPDAHRREACSMSRPKTFARDAGA